MKCYRPGFSIFGKCIDSVVPPSGSCVEPIGAFRESVLWKSSFEEASYCWIFALTDAISARLDRSGDDI